MKKKNVFRFTNHSCIWISRDVDGTIALWSSQPVMKSNCFDGNVDIWLSLLDDSFYPGLTFENSPKQLFL